MKFRHIFDDKKSICVNESQNVTPLSEAVIDCPRSGIIDGLSRMKRRAPRSFIFFTIIHSTSYKYFQKTRPSDVCQRNVKIVLSR